MMASAHDVTVRVRLGFDSPAEAAGFIHGAVSSAMERAGYVGELAVLFQKDDDPNGRIVLFNRGLIDPYDGILPHRLSRCTGDGSQVPG